MTPRRIQRKRTKGWRMPEGAFYVGRGSRWGNPCQVIRLVEGHEVRDRAREVELFRKYLSRNRWVHFDAVVLLRGHDLACWCPLDVPCHGDVLLEIANA